MKKFLIAAAAALALSVAAFPAFAQHAGASHGGGGGGGWHGGGGGWHGGGHGGDWHGHSHVGIGFSFGYPYYWGYPYYAYYPYGYYPYAYGYPYSYGGYYDEGAPSTYIQRDTGDAVAPNPLPRGQYSNPAPRDQYSYYCTDPAGYYPQIATCPSGWLTVVPNGSPHGAPAPR